MIQPLCNLSFLSLRHHHRLHICLHGYGHMTHQLQHQEMRPSTVEQRSCHLSGIVNQTVCFS